MIRLRPNAPLTPAALVQYLRSAVGQTLLNKAGQGMAVAFMPIGEVKGLPIVIPHASELQRLCRQGWLEDMPPALLDGVQEQAA